MTPSLVGTGFDGHEFCFFFHEVVFMSHSLSQTSEKMRPCMKHSF